MLLALEPRPESARLARRALHAHGLNEDIEHTVTLLATEVVGNAVRHASLRSDQRIVFFARLNDDFARVEVADPGAGFDPERVETDGYGLKLLTKLAARWGVDSTKGCRVWFEVDRRSRGGGRFGRAPERLNNPQDFGLAAVSAADTRRIAPLSALTGVAAALDFPPRGRRPTLS